MHRTAQASCQGHPCHSRRVRVRQRQPPVRLAPFQAPLWVPRTSSPNEQRPRASRGPASRRLTGHKVAGPMWPQVLPTMLQPVGRAQTWEATWMQRSLLSSTGLQGHGPLLEEASGPRHGKAVRGHRQRSSRCIPHREGSLCRGHRRRNCRSVPPREGSLCRDRHRRRRSEMSHYRTRAFLAMTS